jgi:signal transduction histidine kinase
VRLGRPMGVRTYLLVSMVALALTSVATTALVINREVDSELTRFTEDDLRFSADTTAEMASAVYLEAGGWSARSVAALRTVAAHRGDAITVLGPRGAPVPGSPRAVAGRGVRAPVVVRGRTVGSVVATHPPDGAVDTAARRLDHRLQGSMGQLLLESGGVAGLLGLLLALGVALRMARPLERLTEVARRMEAGHIETRASGSGGGREVTALAQTMDRLAAALRRQEELRRATVADVTHELRGALVGVVARIEALQDGVGGDPRLVLARMEGDARRVHRLVDDVELLAAAQRPSLLLERQPIDLADVARAAVDRHDAPFRARSIRLTSHLSWVPVDGDAARLSQVLDNLLSNACRYTDPGGRVDVRVSRRGGMAAIDVADSGIGIAPRHLPHVFDRFWRAATAAERSPEGSGVGLAVVSEIVVAHGGRAEVTSTSDRGSTFTVLLPLSSHRAPAAAAGADPFPASPDAVAGIA